MNNELRLTPEERFKGQGIICIICGEKVRRSRVDQATCLSKKCQRVHRDYRKFRGIKAENVKYTGKIQLSLINNIIRENRKWNPGS